MRAALLVVSVMLLNSCATTGALYHGPLLPSLQATAVGDSVHFVLQVTNTSEAPVTLRYNDGQSFDFEVLNGGERVWRWSDGMMFTQALRAEPLEPGETLSFEATWHPAPEIEGELLAVGRLTSSSHPVEQRAHFRLP